MFDFIRYHFEKQWFGGLSRLGAKIGVPVSRLRIFFIYSAFATMGIFFLVYLVLVFVIKLKDLFIKRRPSVFDL